MGEDQALPIPSLWVIDISTSTCGSTYADNMGSCHLTGFIDLLSIQTSGWVVKQWDSSGRMRYVLRTLCDGSVPLCIGSYHTGLVKREMTPNPCWARLL